jgi:F0F1-type ATP synthase epsilon subunit
MPSPTPTSSTIFPVTIFDYDRELFSGEIVALSSHNKAGSFDILGDHTNFISVLDSHIHVHLANGETKEWPIESGVIRCLERQVTVYVVRDKTALTN